MNYLYPVNRSWPSETITFKKDQYSNWSFDIRVNYYEPVDGIMRVHIKVIHYMSPQGSGWSSPVDLRMTGTIQIQDEITAFDTGAKTWEASHDYTILEKDIYLSPKLENDVLNILVNMTNTVDSTSTSLNVSDPIPRAHMGIVAKVSNIWKLTTPYVKVGGAWKPVKPYVKVNGQWESLM